jgi:DNA-binding LacI/PurR family transcriptional regulator
MDEEPASARPPSIRDVARIAGVSRQTVSRVINRHPNISAGTESRVRAAMEELAWRPNSLARALATSRTHTIGLLVSARSHYGPFSAAGGVDDAARARGYTIASATIAGSDDAEISDALDALVRQGVEALVVIAPQERAHEALQRVAIGVPSVTLQWRDGPEGRSVAFDQQAGARAATRYLIDLGHREILHLAGPQDWSEAEDRMRGYLGEMSDRDLTPMPPVLGDWTADSAFELGRRLLRFRDFTAVFSSNDQMALGFIHAAVDAGLRVPQDLSIVGFDDIPEAKHFTPPLTTVRQDFDELGRRAIGILVAEIEGTADTGYPMVTTPELIVRASASRPA